MRAHVEEFDFLEWNKSFSESSVVQGTGQNLKTLKNLEWPRKSPTSGLEIGIEIR